MNIDKQIRYWAQMINESEDQLGITTKSIDEGKVIESAITPFAEFINDYAHKNGCIFMIDAPKGDFKDAPKSYFNKEYEDFDSALKDFTKLATKELYKRFENDINDDPESHGIDYHDDSDFDPEYGYGPAGEYDDRQISEKAAMEADEKFDEQESFTVKEFDEYLKTGKGEDYRQYINNGKEVKDDEPVAIYVFPDYDWFISIIKPKK